MKKITIALAVIIVAAICVSALSKSPSTEERFGGVTNFDGVAVGSDGLQLGTTGTVLTKVIRGTCNLTGGTVTATTTGGGSCAVTGVVAGDLVFVSFASTSASAAVAYATASSTAGNISVGVLNLSGASRDMTAYGTNSAYRIVR